MHTRIHSHFLSLGTNVCTRRAQTFAMTMPPLLLPVKRNEGIPSRNRVHLDFVISDTFILKPFGERPYPVSHILIEYSTSCDSSSAVRTPFLPPMGLRVRPEYQSLRVVRAICRTLAEDCACLGFVNVRTSAPNLPRTRRKAGECEPFSFLSNSLALAACEWR